MSSTSTKHDSTHLSGGEELDELIYKYQNEEKRKNSVKKSSDYLREVLLRDKEKELMCTKLRFTSEDLEEDRMEDLEKKLLSAVKETRKLKEILNMQESDCHMKHVEKSIHRKEIVELQAKIDHLTSENARLNAIISDQLSNMEGHEDVLIKVEVLEDENKENSFVVTSAKREIKRLEGLLRDSNKTRDEWKIKYNKLEMDIEKFKEEIYDKDKEIFHLKKLNRGNEDFLRELENVKELVGKYEADNANLSRLMEEKNKMIEKMRAKVSEANKKGIETGYNKERVDTLLKDNEELYKSLAKKGLDLEELQKKLMSLQTKINEAKELEKVVVKLNSEKEEISRKYKAKKDKYKKMKKNYLKSCNDLSLESEKRSDVDRENDELKKTIAGYTKLIDSLKKSVFKPENKAPVTPKHGSRNDIQL